MEKLYKSAERCVPPGFSGRKETLNVLCCAVCFASAHVLGFLAEYISAHGDMYSTEGTHRVELKDAEFAAFGSMLTVGAYMRCHRTRADCLGAVQVCVLSLHRRVALYLYDETYQQPGRVLPALLHGAAHRPGAARRGVDTFDAVPGRGVRLGDAGALAGARRLGAGAEKHVLLDMRGSHNA